MLLVILPALALAIDDHDIDRLLEQARRAHPPTMADDTDPVIDRLARSRARMSERQRIEFDFIRARRRALAGEYRESIAMFEDLIGRDTEPDQRVHALEMAANLHYRAGNHHRAFNYLSQALEGIDRIDDPVRKARALSLAAFWFMDAGAEQEARSYADRAEELIDGINDERQVCIVLEKLGLAWDVAGELERARSVLQRALEACRSAGDTLYVAAVLARLGAILHHQNRLDAAIERLQASLQHYSQAPFEEGLLLARVQLGRVLFDRGDYQNSGSILEQAVDQLSPGQRWKERADAHYLLARIAMRTGQYRRAYEHLARSNQAQARFLESERKRMVAFHEVRMGMLAREQEIRLLHQQMRADELEQRNRMQRREFQWFGYGLITILVIILGLLLIHATRQLWHFRQLSHHDRLTGLYNHTRFFENAAAAVSQARNLGTPLALVLADIDHFKRINDEYGHLAGDEVLRQAASRLRETFQDAGPIGRVGGEEFAMIVTGEGLTEVRRRIERLRVRLQQTRSDDVTGPVTMSFGIAELEREQTITALRERADCALYQAKHSGRNHVVVG